MLFEQHGSQFWPVDDAAHRVMDELGFLEPLDSTSFKALRQIAREQYHATVQLVEEVNYLTMPHN